MDELIEGVDYVYDNTGNVEFTPQYLLKQHKCCGSGCKHCPYRPRHVENSTRICCRHQAEWYSNRKKCENGN